MRTSALFTVQEMRIYSEAYYTGVVYALRVGVEAAVNYKLATRTRRAQTRAKKRA